MTYSYYKPISDGDTKKIAKLNYFYKKIYIAIACVVAIVGLSLLPFLNSIINLEEPIDHLYLYYILTLANTVVSYLFVYKTTILSAHQEGYLISRFGMVFSTISSVIRIAVMIVFKNYTIYLALFIVFTLINNIYISHVADKRYPYLNQKTDIRKKG